ncbi:MAG: T9SS type A sorting domain-containing protein [Chitinophagaceae bacterium]|nr:T9SS type A sorting domain-containing protein [Chitinophagaceae bacterium]
MPDGSGHIYEPTEITPANGFNYTGDPLKVAIGSQGTHEGDQYALLTTDGLYIWGYVPPSGAVNGLMVSNMVKADGVFARVSDATIGNANSYGLPLGVNPEDVKMLFGSYATLAITTCMGEAWVLSWKGLKNGDGTNDATDANRNSWHRVQKEAGVPLSGVVALRGSFGALMALTANGEIYTWGTGTYLGDGSAQTDGTTYPHRLYATKMAALPGGATPKMIGMTSGGNSTTMNVNSYYVLSAAGEVFSLGRNNYRQLGDFTTTARTSWGNVKSTNSSTNMTGIVWISPNEHSSGQAATVTALTAAGKLWGWGNNSNNMLGAAPAGAVDPRYMFGGLNAANDKVLAIETGGHIVSIFKDCNYKMGYIGHAINGSYANDHDETTYTTFQFDGARFENLCAIPLSPYPEVKDHLEVCEGAATNLADALENTAPHGYTLQWRTHSIPSLGTPVATPASVGAGTYYAFFVSNSSGICTDLEGEKVIVTENPSPVIAVTNINLHCLDGIVDVSAAVTAAPGVSYEYYTGSNASGTLLTNTEVTTTGSYSVIATTTPGCKDTADFMVLPCTVVLPVTLISFDGYKRGHTALLLWTTASEQNNKGFEIERSVDGRYWKNIGFVSGRPGNGNNGLKLDYSFTDNYPVSGNNFYRLKQADFDGKYEYSPVRMVSFSKKHDISIWPNPAKESVNISGLQGDESIKIYDVTGRLVYQSKTGQSNMNIPFDKASEGVYYISVISKDGNVSSHKLVKHK